MISIQTEIIGGQQQCKVSYFHSKLKLFNTFFFYDIIKILQTPGTYMLLTVRLLKYNVWPKTAGTNYQNKNTKGEKEGQEII